MKTRQNHRTHRRISIGTQILVKKGDESGGMKTGCCPTDSLGHFLAEVADGRCPAYRPLTLPQLSVCTCLVDARSVLIAYGQSKPRVYATTRLESIRFLALRDLLAGLHARLHVRLAARQLPCIPLPAPPQLRERRLIHASELGRPRAAFKFPKRRVPASSRSKPVPGPSRKRRIGWRSGGLPGRGSSWSEPFPCSAQSRRR